MRLRITVFVLTAALVAIPGARAATPQLDVLMKADRQSVSPGELITYEVSVRSLTNDLLHVQMSSHIPLQTTGATDQCPDGPIEPDGDICIAPQVPTPGLGEAVHQVQMGSGPVDRHDKVVFRFTVRVDDTAVVGTKLHNHAHAFGDIGPEHDSNEVVTPVVDG